MFDTCRRRYYYHYYLSWNGWNAGAPAVVREAFKLKRLVSLPLWRGQLVHYVATKVLQSMKAKGRIPDRRDVLGYAMERFERQLAFSASKRYLSEPKKRSGKLIIDWLALFEHEYGRPFEQERISRTRGECERAIGRLLDSPILARALDTDTAGWIIEDLDHAAFSQTFTFDGVTVFVKTDFIFRDRDGRFNIVDWKTTRERSKNAEATGNAEVQLGVYGYYAATALGVPVDTIRLYEVNLLGAGTVTEYAVREEMIERFRTHIAAGIEKLSAVLVESDRERNEAKPADQFTKIDGGLCMTCNFYRICKDERCPLMVP
jgi:hypothetical protein